MQKSLQIIGRPKNPESYGMEFFMTDVSSWKSLTTAVESSVLDKTLYLNLPFNEHLCFYNLINWPIPSKASRTFDEIIKVSFKNTFKKVS